MIRGALFVVWGDRTTGSLLSRSFASVRAKNIPTCLITDKDSTVHHPFDMVKRIEFPPMKALCKKSIMYEHSPFDCSVFLDDDTMVLSDINFGFQQAEKHGIAVSFAPVFCDTGLFPIYNTGVIFFCRDSVVKDCFATWQRLCAEDHIGNDQPRFAQAILEESFNPYVLPHTWNFRGHFGQRIWAQGPIVIWHTKQPLPKDIFEWNISPGPGFAYVRDRKLVFRREFKCVCGQSRMAEINSGDVVCICGLKMNRLQFSDTPREI